MSDFEPPERPERPERPAKGTLRAHTLAARRALSDQVRAAAARRLQAVLLDLLATLGGSGSGTVASYLPVGTEPGGPELPAVLAGALPPGGRLLLPALCPDRSLDWVLYQPSAAGPAMPRFATDPPGQRLGAAAIGQASLVVVPALAVDRRGVRLGRGGGSYDRALALASPRAPVVALLYDGELREQELPVERHDRRVSAVITPGLGLVRLPATIAGRLAGHRGG
jgi:5-formyltetrahydrofolate cyclo-ligase